MESGWRRPPPRDVARYPGLVPAWRVLSNARRGWKSRPAQFARRFLFGSATAAIVYPQVPLPAVSAATTAATVSTLTLLGVSASRSGTIVSVDGGAVAYDITGGCTAVFIGMLFVAAVAAYPSPWRKKAQAVLFGIPLLLACNVVRLVTMGVTGTLSRALYEEMHVVYWQMLLILFVAFTFYAWTRSVDRTQAPLRGGSRRVLLAALVFVTTLTTLWILGTGTHGLELYAHALLGSVRGVQAALGIPRARPWSASWYVVFGWDYVSAITTVSLFAASVGVPWARRAKGLLLWALPFTFLAQTLLWVMVLPGGAPATTVEWEIFDGLRNTTLSVFAWLVWIIAQPKDMRKKDLAANASQRNAIEPR